MSQKIDYRVQGLDCSEEVAILRRDVGELPGVIDLEFDVINGRMSVEFEPDATATDQIVAAVATSGMKALPWDRRMERQEGGPWQRYGRLVMAISSGGLLLVGLVVHWVLHGSLLGIFTGGQAEGHVLPQPVNILYVASVVTGSWYVAPKALQAARRLRPDMNFLMVVAVIGAMFIGELFEAATVAFLFAISLLLEHWSVERARNAIGALLDISPSIARLVGPQDGVVRETAVEEVPLGAIVQVRPGERIPLDGEVVEGESTVNQAPMTGESMPVPKTQGDEVFAGTINQDGALKIRTTKVAADTTLARIIHMVESAQSRRAHSQQWVDRFATHYTPAMMFAAIAIAIFPPLLLSASWAEWIYRGLVVLVIACPCALVVSTPVSIVSALTSAARNGVLIKGGAYLEAVGQLRILAMDKTGTLTYGRPEVQRVVPLNGHSDAELLERAAALEANSEHPLARAILRRARESGIESTAADGFQAVRGKGAVAILDGRPFWIGSRRFMHEKGRETTEAHSRALEFENAGHTVVTLGNESHVCGLISIADSLREGVRGVVESIKQTGVKQVIMLTGDNEGTARAVAAEAGIDEFRYELLPEDKVNVIVQLVQKHKYVAMVGDGINDAPAMAAASFGIAMGAMGTDAALETADIVLMSDDLSKLPWLIRHSRRTLGIIKQNISFALGLKLVFIILTLFGLASLWMAILADTGATLLVVFNGLRLLGGAEADTR